MATTPLFVNLILLISFTCQVSAIGSYWSAAYGRSSNTSGVKTDAQDSQPVFDIHVPRIHSTNNLKGLDELYSKCNGIDIREITILKLSELFEAQLLNSSELTNCYLNRIYKMNPTLRAVIEVNPDALNEAYRADSERYILHKVRSPMHGIPVLIKDNCATHDFMETTAGSLALKGNRPKTDAEVVALLRKAGAVILGKANLSEFANFRGTNIPGGWSGRGGQTRNPYNMNENPEGSSSGSAVSVAANLVTVAVGSETDGSLIAPSSLAGICTIKPTVGVVSTKGVIPISHNQDTLGPMGRTVFDVAILLDAMLSTDHKKRVCGGVGYAKCLLDTKYNAKKFRVGVLRQPFWDTNIIKSVNLEHELPQLNSFLVELNKLPNIEIVDPVSFFPSTAILEVTGTNELTVLLHDFKFGINNYLANNVISHFPLENRSYFKKSVVVPKRIKDLKEIIKYNIDHPSVEGYNQDILIWAEETDGLQNLTYIKALESNRDGARQLLNSVLVNHKLDAVVVPSEGRLEGISDPSLSDSPPFGWSVAAIAGYPSCSIPAGIGLKGVPYGLTLLGLPYTEDKLLKIAHIFEQFSPRRTKPTFLI